MSYDLESANREARKIDSRFGISRCEDRVARCWVATVRRDQGPLVRIHVSGPLVFALKYLSERKAREAKIPA